jgi:phage antirepressor YoqD-like protein
MNNLIAQNESLTMSSREIAELVDRRIDSVVRTINSMVKSNNLTIHEVVEGTNNGGTSFIYMFDRKNSIKLAAKLNDDLLSAVIDRWFELESKTQFQIPKTLGQALQLAADQAKQLELAAPKIEYYNKVLDTTNGFTTTEIATELNLSAIKLNRSLKDMNVQRKIGGRWVLTAGNLGNGYAKERTCVDDSGKSRHSMLWTEKGRKFILDLFEV